MAQELIFDTNSLFESAQYSEAEMDWCIYFADNIYASTWGFWRLMIGNKIKFISFDDKQQFGLPKPIDLVKELESLLRGKSLKQIRVKQDTGDLFLVLTDDVIIEIYISSSGYETYDFSIGNKRYIGMGAGDISIIDAK